MINTIIFDFGAVFINLDKEGSLHEFLKAAGIKSLDAEMVAVNQQYEIGQISTEEFVGFYKVRFPHLSPTQIIDLWNCILLDFPKSRLEFIKELSAKGNYNLLLLSNTNDLHISWIKSNIPFYEEFKAQFNAFYLSHEIRLRKPNEDIYDFVLEKNNLKAEDCLFIDDTLENTDTAKQMGIHIWHLNEKTEDVTELFKIKKDLF
ncbi:MAG: HAD family phosphatase [Bacteroidota bacterium]